MLRLAETIQIYFVSYIFSAPNGRVVNVKIQSVNKYGGFVTWDPPQCSARNGELLYYDVSVYKLPENQLTINDLTNDTLYEIDGLSPFTRYGVTVVYVNSKGAGPKGLVLTEFNTTQDGKLSKTVIMKTEV